MINKKSIIKMMTNKESLSPEIIAAVSDIVKKISIETIGYKFEEVLEFFREDREDESITETDFIIDLLESADYQDEGDAELEDLATIGLIAMAGKIGLL